MAAQVIRRFRELGMPVHEVIESPKAVRDHVHALARRLTTCAADLNHSFRTNCGFSQRMV
jgi:hypothetical protein